MSDQFTRFLCAKCGKPGIDSWNKAMFDGLNLDADDLPNPHILGDNCHRCSWPVVISYTEPGTRPRAIYGPINDGPHQFAYEDQAFQQIKADPMSALELLPSDTRDADWSGGCLNARGQLQ